MLRTYINHINVSPYDYSYSGDHTNINYDLRASIWIALITIMVHKPIFKNNKQNKQHFFND